MLPKIGMHFLRRSGYRQLLTLKVKASFANVKGAFFMLHFDKLIILAYVNIYSSGN